MANNDAQDAKLDKAKAKSEKDTAKVSYWKNTKMAGLKLVIKRPKDRLDPTGAGREVVRFKPFYDTFKGDVIKVGYLSTDNKDAVKVLTEDSSCVEIKAKEYEEAMEELNPAPVRVA